MSTLVLRLPYPPSVNHYWRHARGRHYIDRPGQSYRTEVWAEVMRCREPQRVRNIFEGPLAVKVTAAPPDYAYRDIDNIHKALFDSLKHASVYVDDHQIINLCSYWMEPRRDDPRVWVTIDEIEAPEWWKRRADATLKRRRRAASTSSRAT